MNEKPPAAPETEPHNPVKCRLRTIALESEVKQLRTRSKEMARAMLQAEAERDALSTRIEWYKSKLESEEKRADDFREAECQMRAERDVWRQQCERARAEADALRSQVAALESERDGLRVKVSELEEFNRRFPGRYYYRQVD